LSALYGSVGDHETGLHTVETGLEMFPFNLQLLYRKATHMRFLPMVLEKKADTYLRFDEVHPQLDHPHLPDVRYSIAALFTVNDEMVQSLGFIEVYQECYNDGVEE